MAVLGECRLCLSRDVPLLASHILPKWAYRRARNECPPPGLSPDPVQFRDGFALQTSKEAREHLLCGACEQRLSVDEGHVAGLAYQTDGTLGLKVSPESLIAVPHQRDPHVRRASIAGERPSSIARFAASVFWRAHVARQPKVDGLKLWNPQAEALRRFVLGIAALPNRMCINLHVLATGESLETVHSTTTATPCTAKKGDNGIHQFVVAGLLFNLMTGDEAIPGVCLACGSDPQVLFQDWRSVRLLANMTANILEAQPKGGLARRRT
jgi:hypothetical protein